MVLSLTPTRPCVPKTSGLVVSACSTDSTRMLPMTRPRPALQAQNGRALWSTGGT